MAGTTTPNPGNDTHQTAVEPQAAPESEPNLLFICGSGHSGSTLLEMLVAGHPHVAALGELHNLSHQIAIGRACSCGSLPRECPRWQAVAAQIRLRTGIDIFERPFAFRVSRERPRNLPERAIRSWNRSLHYLHFRSPLMGWLKLHRLTVGEREVATNTEMVCAIVRELAGARVLIDSSKDYVRMRERYDSAPLGSVKVVYLSRDGRGVMWSAMKRRRVAAWYGAKEWAKTQRRIRGMLRGVRPQDRIHVRYEDLCTEPEGVLRGICAWLGLSYAEELLALRPPQHHTIAGNKIRLERAMAIRLDEAWRANLKPLQLRVFALLAGAENRRLGYDVS